jgi:xanthine dehydrogenase molybdopterin-binding subunit B
LCRIALAAAKLVVVTYEDLPGSCFTIEDAIANNSYLPYTNKIIEGDVDAALSAEGVNVIEGIVRNGGQEHFYLECNACVCVPGEGLDSISIVSSTQVRPWPLLRENDAAL